MKAIIISIIVATAAPAYAWDGPGMWYRAADDANPGGAGILGTGGAHDHGIKCSDCHVDRVAEPALKLAFVFAPPIVNDVYTPNQTYTVTAQLTGAQVGVGCSGNNVDNFAAAFEDDSGAAVGTLVSDSGQRGPSCTLPTPPPAGTTGLDGDCDVIFSIAGANVDTWTFTWTAPASGPVHIYFGAVDGNCDMMSMNDAVTTGSRTLAPATLTSSRPGRWPLLSVVAIVAITLTSLQGVYRRRPDRR
jgi:hypothetical protein